MMMQTVTSIPTTRIDKFLWAIRVFKTRADATEACRGGKIRVNNVDIKPSRNVRPGDIVSVRKGAVTYSYRVIVPIDKRQGARLVDQFAEDITPEEELAKLNAPVETFFLKRDRGSGRPTKKERRQMDSLWDSLDSEDEDF